MRDDILDHYGPLFLGSRLKRLADRMQADAARFLELTELPVQPSHVPLLAALDAYGPLTVGDAVEALRISQPAVTRIAGTLAELGYLECSRPAADQRQKALDLTPAGRELVARVKARLWPPILAAAEDLCTGPSSPLLAQVRALEERLERRSLLQRFVDRRAAVPGRSADAPAGLTIREFTDDLAPTFYALTAEWVEAMFTLEENDRKILSDPRGTILDQGGVILFVEAEGLGIVGTGALIRVADGIFELTKMGVTGRARGRKAGEFLLRVLLERAAAMRMDELFLLTNRTCAAAINLYEKLGFRHDADVMRAHGGRYARCDVAMRYPLTDASAGRNGVRA